MIIFSHPVGVIIFFHMVSLYSTLENIKIKEMGDLHYGIKFPSSSYPSIFFFIKENASLMSSKFVYIWVTVTNIVNFPLALF